MISKITKHTNKHPLITTTNTMQQTSNSLPTPNAKRLWGEEKNLDSLYNIYLKKISYSSTNSSLETSNDLSVSQQSLQWETRKIRVLQAATIEHIVKVILLIDYNTERTSPDELSLEEERNNIAHIIHVLFCTYRIYITPLELMQRLLDDSNLCSIDQFRFVMHYWMDNYPEDFNFIIEATPNTSDQSSVVDELLKSCKDEFIQTKASKLKESNINGLSHQRISSSSRLSTTSSKRSSILDMDSRYVALQLTAMDLENFLNLKAYALLKGTKSDKRVQRMIKNFNLLSKQVVVTTLKSHSPYIVVNHWISIAMNLRKIKNFNSLKAIIAGLTNESIYRLKSLVWNKISKTTMSNFRMLASIVDDVNNQLVLRQTQLVVEGTAKMSLEDDSFGTIPYLGTFLTDLNMIDARYPSYVTSPMEETSKLKLINFEKCAKQFEILTQVQLLKKNVLASVNLIQRRSNFDELSNSSSNKPAVPQVSRLFENWFFDNEVITMTDKQCYEKSLTLD